MIRGQRSAIGINAGTAMPKSEKPRAPRGKTFADVIAPKPEHDHCKQVLLSKRVRVGRVVEDPALRVSGFRFPVSGFRVHGSGFRVWGAYGLWYRGWGLQLGVCGLGFGV